MPSKFFINIILGCSVISCPFAFGEEINQSITEMSLVEYLAAKNLKIKMGHCCTGSTKQPEFLQAIVEENPEVRHIAEIGFNAGHSSDFFLKASETAKVYSFDLCRFGYSQAAKEYIDQNYPERHTLIRGNSLNTICKFAEENKNLKFDLIFIDGGHSYDCAINDITNMRALAHENTIVVIDDVRIKEVRQAKDECIENDMIIEIETILSKHKAWTICRYKF